jgi:hypothetical protein
MPEVLGPLGLPKTADLPAVATPVKAEKGLLVPDIPATDPAQPKTDDKLQPADVTTAPEKKPEQPPAALTPEPEKKPADADKLTADVLKRTQTKHQQMLATLKEQFPDAYTGVTGKLAEPKPPEIPAAPTPATPMAEEDDADDDIQDILDGRRKKLTIGQLTEQIKTAVLETIKGHEEKLTAAAQAKSLAEEKTAVRQMAHDLIYEKGNDGKEVQVIPDHILKAAADEVATYGIRDDVPGGPAARLRALSTQIQYLMTLENMNRATADMTVGIAAAEAEAAKRNMTGIQPGNTPTPPAQEKSQMDKEVDAIVAAGGGGFGSLLDSHKKT